MYDGGKIIVGLIVCLAFFLSPFIYDAGKAAKAPVPELTEKAKEAKECVESTSYMRAWHMQLLDQWRQEVVRDAKRFYRPSRKVREMSLDEQVIDQWRHLVSDGERRYVSKNDKVYEKSLQKTCLDCHSNKSKFCDQCHDYVGMDPYCWDCHIEPEEKK